MPSAWIFQANPDVYDIDRAVESLEVIHWRAPQHTYQISPGDDGLIWRAGEEAGVVGVCKVLSSPGKGEVPEEELGFYLDGEEPERRVTRVALRVEAVSYLSKAELSSIRGVSDHQIVTAPMGTVFPLEEEAWQSIVDARPEVSRLADLELEASHRSLPEPFAWEDRRKSVYPMPGGFDSYLDTLRQVLIQVDDTRPSGDDLEQWFEDTFDVSNHSSRMSLSFLERASLLSARNDPVEPTDHAEYWLESGDNVYLIGLLHSRIQLIGEFLDLLEPPCSPDELLDRVDARYGMGWNTRAQIDRRRGWLQSAGFLDEDAENQWHLTDEGRHLLGRLELAEPRSEDAADAGSPDEDGGTEEEEVNGAEGEAVPSSRQERARNLADALRTSSRDSDNPNEFERTVAEAFAFLGYDSSWLGGSGQTDVLLVAELGPDFGYRVVVDCKSTSRNRVSEGQISWVALQDHGETHGADFVALVGPGFAGSKLPQHASAQDVALIDVNSLASLLKQHAKVPVGLDVYRTLFTADDVAQAASTIGEAAEEVERAIHVAVEAVQVISREEGEEGALSSQDLYWLLRDRASQLEGLNRERIDETLKALAHPSIGALRRVGDAYHTTGSMKTAAARFRKLANLLED